MIPETIVRLRITSCTHSPEFISEALGILCDKSWHLGDTRPKTTIKEIANGWILNSGLDKSTPIEDQLESLLKRIAPCSDKIELTLPDALIEVSCVIYADSPPALNFDKSIIDGISSLHASLDIDLYF
jgi:hypothetical protein